MAMRQSLIITVRGRHRPRRVRLQVRLVRKPRRLSQWRREAREVRSGFAAADQADTRSGCRRTISQRQRIRTRMHLPAGPWRDQDRPDKHRHRRQRGPVNNVHDTLTNQNLQTNDFPGFADQAYTNTMSALGITTNTLVARKDAVELLVSSTVRRFLSRTCSTIWSEPGSDLDDRAYGLRSGAGGRTSCATTATRRSLSSCPKSPITRLAGARGKAGAEPCARRQPNPVAIRFHQRRAAITAPTGHCPCL
jgi:hypothetical protein